jgi:hypothetical protein
MIGSQSSAFAIVPTCRVVAQRRREGHPKIAQHFSAGCYSAKIISPEATAESDQTSASILSISVFSVPLWQIPRKTPSLQKPLETFRSLWKGIIKNHFSSWSARLPRRRVRRSLGEDGSSPVKLSQGQSSPVKAFLKTIFSCRVEAGAKTGSEQHPRSIDATRGRKPLEGYGNLRKATEGPPGVPHEP